MKTKQSSREVRPTAIVGSIVAGRDAIVWVAPATAATTIAITAWDLWIAAAIVGVLIGLFMIVCALILRTSQDPSRTALPLAVRVCMAAVGAVSVQQLVPMYSSSVLGLMPLPDSEPSTPREHVGRSIANSSTHDSRITVGPAAVAQGGSAALESFPSEPSARIAGSQVVNSRPPQQHSLVLIVTPVGQSLESTCYLREALPGVWELRGSTLSSCEIGLKSVAGSWVYRNVSVIFPANGVVVLRELVPMALTNSWFADVKNSDNRDETYHFWGSALGHPSGFLVDGAQDCQGRVREGVLRLLVQTIMIESVDRCVEDRGEEWCELYRARSYAWTFYWGDSQLNRCECAPDCGRFYRRWTMTDRFPGGITEEMISADAARPRPTVRASAARDRPQ